MIHSCFVICVLFCFKDNLAVAISLYPKETSITVLFDPYSDDCVIRVSLCRKVIDRDCEVITEAPHVVSYIGLCLSINTYKELYTYFYAGFLQQLWHYKCLILGCLSRIDNFHQLNDMLFLGNYDKWCHLLTLITTVKTQKRKIKFLILFVL